MYCFCTPVSSAISLLSVQTEYTEYLVALSSAKLGCGIFTEGRLAGLTEVCPPALFEGCAPPPRSDSEFVILRKAGLIVAPQPLALPWKSGASAPREGKGAKEGFSTRGRLPHQGQIQRLPHPCRAFCDRVGAGLQCRKNPPPDRCRPSIRVLHRGTTAVSARVEERRFSAALRQRAKKGL